MAATAVMFQDVATRELYGTPSMYGAISRRIAEAGRWFPLMYGGEAYVLKPPLMFWLTAATVKMVGPGGLAITLWSRLFGVAAVGLTAFVGRRLFGRATGFYAGLILLCSPTLVKNAATFRLDTALLVGVLTSALALVAPRGAWRPPVFYGGVVLAVMAKGPVGLLALGLGALWWLSGGRERDPAAVREWLRWSVLLLVPVIWYAWVHREIGTWATEALVADLGRSELVDDQARWASGLETYLGDPLVRFLPFTPFVVWGVWRAATAARRGGDDRHGTSLRWLFVWAAAVVFVLLGKDTHRERYLLPAFAPLAILGGRELARAVRARVPLWGAAALLAIGLVGVANAVIDPPRREREDPRVLSAMREEVERAYPGEREPVPLLDVGPVDDLAPGPEWSPQDWSELHLGRPVELVGEPRGPGPHLVFLPRESGILEDPEWRVILESRYAALVVPADRGVGRGRGAPL